VPQTYRDRLLREGAVLAATGAAGSAALLATTEEARRWPLNTVGQLAGVAALLAWLTPRVAAQARRAPIVLRAGDGDPTPLHHVPVPVLAFAVLVGPVGRATAPHPRLRERAGADAALRVTGGALLVGLWQAVVLRRAVGPRAVRLAGSRLGRTRLGRTLL
jgi:hypothetical protein